MGVVAVQSSLPSNRATAALVATTPPAAPLSTNANRAYPSEPEPLATTSAPAALAPAKGNLPIAGLPTSQDVARALSLRASTTRAARREKLLADDALSDQK